MTRTIKASEVKPGMVVKWESEGFTHEGTVERVTSSVSAYTKRFISGSYGMNVSSETTVTVLSEPQPEEPTEFGSRVVVDGRRFLRAPEKEFDVQPWLEEGEGFWLNWDNLCRMGPVTVIPDQGWTVSDVSDANQEVPERIEEWPEDDTALREHKWLDRYGSEWHSERHILDTPDSWVTRLPNGRRLDFGKPTFGPWTRVTDA